MEATLNERFKKVLFDLGISESEMASRIGISKQALNQVILGQRKLSANIIEGIVRVFPSVNIRYLLTGNDTDNMKTLSDNSLRYDTYNPMQEKDKQISELHEMIKQLISKIPDAENSQTT